MPDLGPLHGFVAYAQRTWAPGTPAATRAQVDVTWAALRDATAQAAQARSAMARHAGPALTDALGQLMDRHRQLGELRWLHEQVYSPRSGDIAGFCAHLADLQINGLERTQLSESMRAVAAEAYTLLAAIGEECLEQLLGADVWVIADRAGLRTEPYTPDAL